MWGLLGGEVTEKEVADIAVPPGVVTLIRPVVAPLGTAVLISESSVTENVAPVPLNFTALAPVSPVPVIVTGVVTGPLSGLKVVIVGVGEGLTVNSMT